MAKRIWLLGAAVALAQGAWAEAPKLASVFSDHMVIQRDQPVPLFGTAEPGATVTVSMGSAGSTGRVAINAKADPDGNWQVEMPALEAGGPYDIHLRSKDGDKQVVTDILAGDVFLCSGQSNMEWPLSASSYNGGIAAGETHERIRLLDVSHVSSAARRDTLPEGNVWEVATPEATKDFSAVCYFTGRAVEADYDVPVGLIDSSWGGSRIEPWISEATLKQAGGFGAPLALLASYARDPMRGLADYAKEWMSAWSTNPEHGLDLPWTGDASLPWQPVPGDLRDWQTWGIPDLATHTGQVWHKTTFELTDAQAGQAATLNLAGIDDVDLTWLNGQPVGSSFGWGDVRTYPVPAGILKAGTNTLVVNVQNDWGPGGMLGPVDEMSVTFADGGAIPVGTGWSWLKVAPGGVPSPSAPWFSIKGYAILHNAMLAPLDGIRLKGALWYQGESNAGEGPAYEQLMNLLIADWRGMFGADLPAIIYQLPRYGGLPSEAGTSGWGEIRESMRKVAVTDDKTGLVVLVDVGDPADIHPPNKEFVAKRGMSVVRSLFYGEAIAGPSGPEAVGVLRTGNSVRVDFAGIDQGLQTISSNQPIGFEACDGEGKCQYVGGSVSGSAVMLYLPDGVAADEIRYCQGDSPLCNLFDKNGLPAGPFRMPVTPSDQPE